MGHIPISAEAERLFLSFFCLQTEFTSYIETSPKVFELKMYWSTFLTSFVGQKSVDSLNPLVQNF
mgnify:CR=1 FL=1